MKNQRNQTIQMWALRAALVLSASLTLATPGGASESALPEGVALERVITNDPRTTVRGCIGQRDTPYCAVQTLIAGEMWSDPALCDAVRDHGRLCAYHRFGDARHPYVIEFKPVGLIAPQGRAFEILKQDAGYDFLQLREGDVFLVLDQKRWSPDPTCHADSLSDPEHSAWFCPPVRRDPQPDQRTFHLRKNESGWRVIHLESPYDPLFSSFDSWWFDLKEKVTVEAYLLTRQEHPVPNRLALEAISSGEPPPAANKNPEEIIPFNFNPSAMNAQVRGKRGWSGTLPTSPPWPGCIGNPITPFCAAITAIAWEATQDPILCNAVFSLQLIGNYCEKPGKSPSPDHPGWRLDIYPVHLMASFPSGDHATRFAGDKVVLYLHIRWNEIQNLRDLPAEYQTHAKPSPSASPRWESAPRNFFLQKENGRWRVAAFDSQNDPLNVRQWNIQQPGHAPNMDPYFLTNEELP
ncbi:MAG: hypothetical protein HQL51_07935 [Magnetococcales bacterium]|nr:hypothetical protein [Magnetococcales bacterium]